MTVTLEQFLFVFGLTLFAGLSTGIGGFIAFFTGKDSDSGTFLSASLGFSAGVMVYISLVELMAQAHGLGVLYSGFFTMAARLSRGLRRELGLGRKQKVVTALVLGYPAVRYRRTAPKEAAAISWK